MATESPNSTFFHRLPRNLAVWSLICGVSAGPSFVVAISEFRTSGDMIAMVAGVATFAVAYALLSSTDGVSRLKRNRRVVLTLRIGYISRMVLSLLSILPPFLVVDFICGIVSVSITGLDRGQHEPVSTYITTMIQGVFLNFVLAMYMGVVFVVMLLFRFRPGPANVCQNCGYDLRQPRALPGMRLTDPVNPRRRPTSDAE